MAKIKLSKIYPVSGDKVWEYLTNDELLGSWCMPSENFLLRKGGEFKFQGTPSRFWDGTFINTIIDYTENSFLSYQCVNEQLKLNTVVTWKLTETEGLTKLTLEHSGFRTFKDLFIKIALTTGWKEMLNANLYKKLTVIL
jgi:uncharacterized protein YndB with AHSA1/START domain